MDCAVLFGLRLGLGLESRFLSQTKSSSDWSGVAGWGGESPSHFWLLLIPRVLQVTPDLDPPLPPRRCAAGWAEGGGCCQI